MCIYVCWYMDSHVYLWRPEEDIGYLPLLLSILVLELNLKLTARLVSQGAPHTHLPLPPRCWSSRPVQPCLPLMCTLRV